MSLGRRYKDPDETSLFTFDWTRRLGADTITSYVLTADAGLTIEDDSIVDGNQKVSLLVSGGVDGGNYSVVCAIQTAGGQSFERTGVIAVRSR